ncbi:CHAT domain-containing protein [Phormidium sp. CLA17]|uniref:CHAT domain-containing protein n=1 Tax=Leptolyngbya sp. Cla-17 TaxID=2803751 RepID=UPI001490ED40|nr:CHAT domain-containing tetratricopeptide repeat protein [Leptolyngbya sp. Cla-17]MBM0743474.1 CHAT domain-containing protein [Leptolyngbya sp. Cla-17]
MNRFQAVLGAIATGLIIISPAILDAEPSLPTPILKGSEGEIPADQFLQAGDRHYQAGQTEQAIAAWQRAQRAYQQVQNRQGEGTALANLGMGYVTLERYQDAVTVLETFLPIARSLNDQPGEAKALGNLGIAYKMLGSYAPAIQAHRQAGKLMRQLGDRSGLGQVLLNLGNAFEAVGDYDSAAIAYQQSLKLAEESKDLTGTAIALSNLGAVYANQGKDEDAITTFQKSLSIHKATQNAAGEASTLINLGSTHHSLGKRDDAIRYYQQSLAIAQQLNNRHLAGEALGSLGLAYEDLKDFPKAIAHHRQSLEIGRSLNNPEAIGTALNNLAHALFGAGNLAEAETTLRSAVTQLDALRPGLSDLYRVSIFDTQVHTYSLLQQVLIAAKKYEAALEVAEQGRARAFVELLAKKQGSGVKNQATSGKEARTSHAARRTPQVALANPLASPFTIAQIKAVARQQNATLVEYAIVPDDDFKFRGKQRARESELLIWVIQPSGQVAFRRVDLKPLWQQNLSLAQLVSISRQCLYPTTNCNRLLNTAQKIPPQTVESDANTPRRSRNPAMQRLHQLLIQPIADLLPKKPDARIVFIPQESLFLVPFPALQTAKGTYLIEQHTLLTAPAIQVLDLTRKQRLTQKSSQPMSRSLIVGNPTMPVIGTEALPPLPSSETEAKQIAELLKTKALIGSQATERQIVQDLPKARRAHFATHGLLEYGQDLGDVGIPGALAFAPSPGSRALASDSGNDGLLTSNEILDLRLVADLVVLSACDTGRGRITGDGVIGLSRAFISAGVPSVVVSLWAVSDVSTANLMVAFYQALQQQPNKAQALRQAMLETMKVYPRPLDWAAFTLIGEAE